MEEGFTEPQEWWDMSTQARWVKLQKTHLSSNSYSVSPIAVFKDLWLTLIRELKILSNIHRRAYTMSEHMGNLFVPPPLWACTQDTLVRKKANWLQHSRCLNWHLPPCMFKVYNVHNLIHVYIAKMVPTMRWVNTSFTSHGYHCVCVSGENTQGHSLSNFQVYNTVLLAAVTTLGIRP